MSPGNNVDGDKLGKRFITSGNAYGAAISFVGAVVGFALVGYFVDRHFDSQPWGIIVGLALGFVGGLYNLIKESGRVFREARLEDNEAAREARDDSADRKDGA